MISVSKSSLPGNKPTPLTLDEIENRRSIARQRHQERMAKTEDEAAIHELSENVQNSLKISVPDAKLPITDEQAELEDDVDCTNDEVFIAFARVYSGTLRKGAKIFVLTPKHDPRTLE